MSRKTLVNVKKNWLMLNRPTIHIFLLTFQMKAHIVPVKDLRNMNVTFPIPDLQSQYKCNVRVYLYTCIEYKFSSCVRGSYKTLFFAAWTLSWTPNWP